MTAAHATLRCAHCAGRERRSLLSARLQWWSLTSLTTFGTRTVARRQRSAGHSWISRSVRWPKKYSRAAESTGALPPGKFAYSVQARNPGLRSRLCCSAVLAFAFAWMSDLLCVACALFCFALLCLDLGPGTCVHLRPPTCLCPSQGSVPVARPRTRASRKPTF